MRTRKRAKTLAFEARPTKTAGVGKRHSPRRHRRAELKKTAILDASPTLFSRLGLHGTTLDQIAETADVLKTNLLYYFASKDELYAAVHHRLLDGRWASLRELGVNDDPATAIGDYFRRKLEFSRCHPDAARLFCLEIVQGAPLIGTHLRTMVKELVSELRRVEGGASGFHAFRTAL
ncbi:TetR family transcriptional regulator C-terminal domain-containing protein [Bradyrhizobium oligotrophicum]|uniref:TetR family transcriptional regulator C-terminal domain-containing protein n=1 Tax=Bradyrhizobium oligotrophicum TaxID=44255 RepID=UPI003EBCD37F